jgi:ElaB/YqjD/DUF883 family membrane-anchored ribosome-binding protein
MMALEAALDEAEGIEAGTKRKPYKAETVKSYGHDDGRLRESHESFGLIGFSRVSGGAHLFGSHLERHQHFITMTLRRASVEHDLSRDWYHSDGRMPVVEVWLSASQFAEAITTMNHGEGVPCTIAEVEGISMERVPDEVRAENVKLRDEFKRKVASRVAEVRKVFAQVDKLVETGSSVSKGRAREIRDALGQYLNRIDRDSGFVVDSFNESAEKVVQNAKAEIESMMNLALQRAGVKALRDGDATLALPGTDGAPALPESTEGDPP